MDEETLLFAIDHVFLPPKLPDAEEAELQVRESSFLQVLCNAANSFVNKLEDARLSGPSEARRIKESWVLVQRMLKRMLKLHGVTGIAPHTIQGVLSSLNING